MSMNAIAIVKISPETLREALRPSGGGELPEVFDRGAGLSFRLQALDDASLVVTTFGFDREPDELAEALKRCVGGVLAAHRDPRGVLVFPDKAMPTARSYDTVVEEIGELGFWISLAKKPVPAPAPRKAAVAPARAPSIPQDESSAGAPFAGLEDQIRALMNAVPPEALAQMQQVMASGDSEQIAAMESQLQAMVGQGPLAALQESLISAFGGVEPEDPATPGEDPMAALLAHTQAQMDAIEKSDPVAFEQLRKQLGAMGLSPRITAEKPDK